MPEVSLEMPGELMRRMMEKQDRMQEQQDRMRDDITVLTGIAMRVDVALQGLTTEVRTLHRQHARHDRENEAVGERLDGFEARLAAIEERLAPA